MGNRGFSAKITCAAGVTATLFINGDSKAVIENQKQVGFIRILVKDWDIIAIKARGRRELRCDCRYQLRKQALHYWPTGMESCKEALKTLTILS